jgi:hypothetical protein
MKDYLLTILRKWLEDKNDTKNYLSLSVYREDARGIIDEIDRLRKTERRLNENIKVLMQLIDSDEKYIQQLERDAEVNDETRH